MQTTKLFLKRIDKKGFGVFSKTSFRKGDTIIELVGRILTKKQFYTNKKTQRYGIQIGKNTYIGPSDKVDDYEDHSCNPDSWVKIVGKRAFLIAMRNIKVGEEICFDYSIAQKDNVNRFYCDCDSKNCRKTIGNFGSLPIKTKRKYRRLGIVPRYIND